MEATLRRTSPGAPAEMPGPMSGTPTGITTPSAQVDKAVPPGERSNKTPVYVSGVRDVRKFLDWVRAKSGYLAAQMKNEYVMLVPETADGFRTTVSALRSLGEGEGVSFHTFSLPEDRCMLLLLKNLGKRMPETDIREELESLHIQVQAAMQLRSRRRDQVAEMERPLTPNFIVSLERGSDVTKVSSLLPNSADQSRDVQRSKRPLQCKCYQPIGHTQRNCGYAPRCMACGDAHPSRTCITPKQQLKCCSCGGNHTANYRGYCKWKEAKTAAAMRALRKRGRMDVFSTRVPAPKSASLKQTPEQEALGTGCKHVVRGGRTLN
jgi:hypothetical protein